MRSHLLLWAAAAVLFAIPALADDWPIEAMNRQIDQTNFVVNEGCSGTLIGLEGRYVLTANHCIRAQYETVDIEDVAEDGTVTTRKVKRQKPGIVQLVTFDGSEIVKVTAYRTKIISSDAANDLALLHVISPIPNTMAARLSCGVVSRGAVAYVVGNPKGVLVASVVKGVVSSTQRNYEMLQFGDGGQRSQPLMQLSAGIVGGNSGGAVFDASGYLIGVPVLAHTANEVLGFAVPLDQIKTFLTNAKLASLFAYCGAPR